MHCYWKYLLPASVADWLAMGMPMRNISDSLSSIYPLTTGDAVLTIQHAPLPEVSSNMMLWWNRFFYYQKLKTPEGEMIPAYRVWHPIIHRNAWIERHALSGEIGAVAGTWSCMSDSSRPGSISITRARVLSLNSRHNIQLLFCDSKPAARLVETYRDSTQGLLCMTHLQLTKTTPVEFCSSASPFEETNPAISNWIKHRTEQVGNLEIILPPIFASEGDRYFSMDTCSDGSGAMA